jgi:23S rRNA (uracil747-C5)-methyltransferase
MRCDYFEAGLCRSCRLIETPYATQLRIKQGRVAAALAAWPSIAWRDPVASAEHGFRNKAKMVVAGTVGRPTLGILSPDGRGIDLRECGLHDPRLHDAMPVLARFVTAAGLTPYSVPARTGELKHVVSTVSPDGELMVRFVLRSRDLEPGLRRELPALLGELPIAVATMNLQPEHKAILEGDEEAVLTERETLPMRLRQPWGEVELQLRPRSFFQTNTEVAAALYRHARELVEESSPSVVWDLYCGVGGFGLHVAAPGRGIVGVESSAAAVASARAAARASGIPGTTWFDGDAFAYARSAPRPPDLVIVNPPRRGIGAELATWLERSDVAQVIYSSCNVDSLARDLEAMPSLRPVSARLLDMFPHTPHHELLVHLTRT